MISHPFFSTCLVCTFTCHNKDGRVQPSRLVGLVEISEHDMSSSGADEANFADGKEVEVVVDDLQISSSPPLRSFNALTQIST